MDTPTTADRPVVALWNPNAAAAWSLLFTPVFGAWLHALNWRALGDTEREKASLAWAVGGAAILVVYLLIDATSYNSHIGDQIERSIEVVFIVAWYLASARAQANLVRDAYAGAYEKKSWRTPLLWALAGFGIYVGLTIAIAATIGLRNL
jgi:hypothetical protein